MKPNTVIRLMATLSLITTCMAEPARVSPPGMQAARQPQVAETINGSVCVAFGQSNGVYVASSHDQGKTFGKPVKIGELTQLALGMRRGPRIATAKEMVIVTAISHADGNVYAWRFNPEAKASPEPVKINDVATSAREGMQGLAGDGKGNCLAVWLDLRNKKTELWGARSSDGGLSWSKNMRIYKSPDLTICECCHPSVAYGTNGEVVVMWRNWLEGNRDLYWAVSKDGGITFSEAAKLGTGNWPLKGCPMDGGSVAVAGGKTGFAWRRMDRLYFNEADGTETLLTDRGVQPTLIPTSSGFAFAWQNQGKLYFKKSLDSEVKDIAENAGYAAAAYSPKLNDAYVTWEGADGIYLERASQWEKNPK